MSAPAGQTAPVDADGGYARQTVLGDRLEKDAAQFPGFDGLRLIGATAVIFSHAYLIATGTEDTEPMVRLLGRGNIAGLYGVFTFFIISGFLLARSLDRRGSAVTYAVNRSLRLLPAFFVCILLTALVVGPITSALTATEYFKNEAVIGYLRLGFTALADSPLPGVFQYTGPISAVVNGSLWSLPYEALSYLFLLVLWIGLRRISLVACVIVGLAVLGPFIPLVNRHLTSVGYTLPFFAGGVGMYWVHKRFGSSLPMAAACALALVVCAWFGQQQYAFAIFGAYVIVALGTRANPASSFARRFGDCSYGLYLYGWPIEQIVRQVTGMEEPLLLFLFAFPATLIVAYLSCHLVELPAMSMRNRLGSAIRRYIHGLNRASHSNTAVTNAAALAGFALPATFILTSKKEWWFVVQVAALLALTTVSATLVVASFYFLKHRITRRPATPP